MVRIKSWLILKYGLVKIKIKRKSKKNEKKMVACNSIYYYFLKITEEVIEMRRERETVYGRGPYGLSDTPTDTTNWWSPLQLLRGGVHMSLPIFFQFVSVAAFFYCSCEQVFLTRHCRHP